LTWRDATSVRIKRKVPVTQRYHRERAARVHCLAISKVQFIYWLPTYTGKIKLGRFGRVQHVTYVRGSGNSCRILFRKKRSIFLARYGGKWK